MQKKNVFIVFVLFLFPAGCGVPPKYEKGKDWPGGIPPKSYYQHLYEADNTLQDDQSKKQYFSWVLRFYKGRPPIVDGWHGIMDEIMEGHDEQDTVLRAKLHYLGHLISGEWAKSDAVRRINSTMLRTWQVVLKKARDLDRIEEAIDTITQDVLQILTDKMDPENIELELYDEFTKDDSDD